MEIISKRNQSSFSSHSTARSHKRGGLSLTSKSRCSSSKKAVSSVASTQRATGSGLCFNNDTYAKIQFKNVHLSSLEQVQSKHIASKIIQRPKITFRYTSQAIDMTNAARINRFYISNETHSQVQKVHALDGQSVDSRQKFQNITLTKPGQKSVQKKNYLSPSFKQLPNQNRSLLDSRTVSREIVYEQTYTHLPFIQQTQAPSPMVALDHNNFTKKITSLEAFSNKELQPKKTTQNFSPYHILISTAKRCKSRQLSPLVLKQAQKIADLPIHSLQKIPQIQEFSAFGIYEQELTSYPSNKTAQNIQEGGSKSVFTILGDKNFNLIEQKGKISSQKGCNNVKASVKQSKNYKSNNKQTFFLKQNENIAPLGHKSILSGKRNSTRIRQIQKRLEQIITICNDNI